MLARHAFQQVLGTPEQFWRPAAKGACWLAGREGVRKGHAEAGTAQLVRGEAFLCFGALRCVWAVGC